MSDRDVTKLAEPFQKFVRMFLKDCRDQDVYIFITDGFRTTKDQQDLWSIGRTVEGIKVTWMDGVNTISNHQLGCAIDIAFDPDFHGRLYPYNSDLWRKVADIAEIYNIDWGYDLWKADKPHFQWNGSSVLKDKEFYNYTAMKSPKTTQAVQLALAANSNAWNVADDHDEYPEVQVMFERHNKEIRESFNITK